MITGGSDHEQQREGDFLTKDERYGRTREYIQILKQAWTRHEPFDYTGDHYRFADFVSDVFPVQQPRPAISFGGSSDAAYAVGDGRGRHLCLWGEPLADTKEQIEPRRRPRPPPPGAPTPPRSSGFPADPGPTEQQAWAKAEDIVRRIETPGRPRAAVPRAAGSPGEHGSQRLLAIAGPGDRHDRSCSPARRSHRGRGQLQRPGRHARSRWPKHCWPTSTSASTSSRPVVTTHCRTRSTSATRSSHWSAPRSSAATGRSPDPAGSLTGRTEWPGGRPDRADKLAGDNGLSRCRSKCRSLWRVRFSSAKYGNEAEGDGTVPDTAGVLPLGDPGQHRSEERLPVDGDGRCPDIITDLVHPLVMGLRGWRGRRRTSRPSRRSAELGRPASSSAPAIRGRSNFSAPSVCLRVPSAV